MARAGAITLVLSSLAAPTGAAIGRCESKDVRCGAPPAGSRIIGPPRSDSWARRATEAVLTEHAREMAEWSKEAVLVASDIAVRTPRRHRRVSNRAAGEQALLACGREQLLLVISQREIRRAPDSSVLVDMQVDLLGATCDRSERTIFAHGTDWYRVIFAKGRVDVLRTVSVAF